ncbi:MAG TPA: DUF3098 domain-containing protein [Flavipsychrobacter sp.]
MSKNKSATTLTQKQTSQQDFLFDKSNYIWMLAGVLLVVIGFMLMSGGKNEDPTKFNYDEIYSTARVTIAPLMILLGFAIEIYAIMKKPAAKNSDI